MKKMVNVELNKMIYSALTTKVGKKCKHEQVLKDLSYTLVDETGTGSGSTQGYYSVRNEKNNRTIVISKNYGGTTSLFTYGTVCPLTSKNLDYGRCVEGMKNIRKVDYENILNKTHYSQRERAGYGCSSAVYKYKDLKHDIRLAKKMAESYSNDISKAKDKIEGLKKDMIRYEKYINQYKETAEKYEQQMKNLLAR